MSKGKGKGKGKVRQCFLHKCPKQNCSKCALMRRKYDKHDKLMKHFGPETRCKLHGWCHKSACNWCALFRIKEKGHPSILKRFVQDEKRSIMEWIAAHKCPEHPWMSSHRCDICLYMSRPSVYT